MFRTLFRRGVPVLALTLLLLGAAPAAAQTSFLDRWDGFWGWLVSFWYDGETGEGEGDRGLGLDPDGLTSGGNRGPELDPNGLATEGEGEEGDRGLGADPNG